MNNNLLPKNVDGGKINLAIFASGAGSNAEQIIRFFSTHPTVSVALVVCNNLQAGVLNIARLHNIAVLMLDKPTFLSTDTYVHELQRLNIDFIVLAGFLWKIPASLVAAFPRRIVNIHPALLPNYGGKGMYGAKVHEAVLAANEQLSGITIHYVDELYDHGDIIFQATCPVLPGDTPALLAARIHELEHRHFPQVIADVLEKDCSVVNHSSNH